MKNYFTTLLIISFIVAYSSLHSQEAKTGKIRGKIIERITEKPLQGLNIQILELKKGVRSDINGEFLIKELPIGRFTLKVSGVGYEPNISNINITTANDFILTVRLNEAFTETDEISVVGSRGYFTPINESSIVSATEFTLEETQRYAGSRMDPARMVQNYAGVLGGNDSRNDIIIRGGSPTELLWRIDGIDIPNPNHFGTQGATGGPVSAINTLVLDDSDFLTGGYSAEYGGKISGVFDLKTRSGNKQNYEYLAQFGFNGVEFGTEGPITKNSSFIANYRYSALDLMEKMGIEFGFSGIPRYQDGILKVDWEITNKDKLSLTTLYGKSSIDIKISETDDVFTGDLDIENGTDIFTSSINWRHLFNDKLIGKLTTGIAYGRYFTNLDSLTTDFDNNVTDSYRWFENNSSETFITGKYELNYIFNRKSIFTAGAEGRVITYNINEERFTERDEFGKLYNIQKDSSAMHYQGFLNWNYKPMKKIISNIGIFSQYNSISNKLSVEPRFAFSYNFAEKHTINAGTGIYSQELPLVLYLTHKNNVKLDFTKSIHYIIGYHYQPNYKWLIKTEGFYKDIDKAPVEVDKTSWSFLNSGTSFGSVTHGIHAQSEGKGKAYGAEFSLLKSFSEGYYITSTATYIRQEYLASDGKWRFGAFDNKYISNILAGYEWKISNDFILEISAKYTIAGGAPYTPIDMEKSKLQRTTFYDNEKAFTLRNPDYKRFDIKFDFINNYKNMSIISYFSIENVFNFENVLERIYDVKNDKVKILNQLGMFPVGGIRIEF